MTQNIYLKNVSKGLVCFVDLQSNIKKVISIFIYFLTKNHESFKDTEWMLGNE